MRGIQDLLAQKDYVIVLNIFEIEDQADRVAKILAFCQVEIQRAWMKESGNSVSWV